MSTDITLHGKVDAVQCRAMVVDEDTPHPRPFTAATLFAGGSKVTIVLEPADYGTAAYALRRLANAIELGERIGPGGYYPVIGTGWVSTEPTPEAPTAGEKAHPEFAYHLTDGTPLMGPCDTDGCKYASKPGGARHDGECSNA